MTTSGGGSATITNLTTTQARDDASYTAFDFTNDWYQNVDMRPILRAESGPTINGVTAVSNLNQLALMGSNLSGNYQLTKDINASNTDGSNTSGIWSPSGWVPVGSPLIPDSFNGALDGKDHSISNLTIDRSAGRFVGLFGHIRNGDFVRNIHLTNAQITGGEYVGALTGFIGDTTISNASVSGNISGIEKVGGLVGSHSNGTITQSMSSATVSGTEHIGGLVGNSSGTIIDSSSSATVSGTYGVGGLVGFSSGTITTSSSSGAISGGENIGGLVGYQNGGSITSSKASGPVSGSLRVGGLAGALTGGTIDQSFATGSVTNSGLLTGGLVGVAVSGTITRSYATGSVSGTDRVGGLVGISLFNNIDQSYATGSVTDTGIGTWNGGLIGYSHTDTLSNSFYDMTTTGRTNAIGINYDNLSNVTRLTGLTTAQFQNTNAFMTLAGDPATYGWDFNTIWSPPSAGYYPELYAVNPVIWADSITTNSTYGQSTGTVTTVTSHGGPASYVFGPMPDGILLTGSTVAVDPTVSAGTTNGALVTQNVFKNSSKGQNFRVFYHGSAVQEVAKANLTVTASFY